MNYLFSTDKHVDSFIETLHDRNPQSFTTNTDSMGNVYLQEHESKANLLKYYRNACDKFGKDTPLEDIRSAIAMVYGYENAPAFYFIEDNGDLVSKFNLCKIFELTDFNEEKLQFTKRCLKYSLKPLHATLGVTMLTAVLLRHPSIRAMALELSKSYLVYLDLKLKAYLDKNEAIGGMAVDLITSNPKSFWEYMPGYTYASSTLLYLLNTSTGNVIHKFLPTGVVTALRGVSYGERNKEYVDSRAKEILESIEKTTLFVGIILFGLVALSLAASRYLKTTQNRKHVHKHEKEDRQLLMTDVRAFPLWAHALCQNADPNASTVDFRRALMTNAEQYGVVLRYRHFFNAYGRPRTNKEVCKMISRIPPLPKEQTSSRNSNR